MYIHTLIPLELMAITEALRRYGRAALSSLQVGVRQTAPPASCEGPGRLVKKMLSKGREGSLAI